MFAFLSPLSFLITSSFWSKIGFLISYLATSFIALEVLRLFFSDASKREAEKFLEEYTKQRNVSPRRTSDLKKISIDELERPRTPSPSKSTRAAATPDSERTLVHETRRRRTTSSSPAPHPSLVKNVDQPAPARKLRKRSDTLTSTGSSDSKHSLRRRREASPASDAGSKASSRQASPLRRLKRREEDVQKGGLGLGLRGLVRGKV